jgi:photosystem II stability/assembly factor-like uncharacterized protein
MIVRFPGTLRPAAGVAGALAFAGLAAVGLSGAASPAAPGAVIAPLAPKSLLLDVAARDGRLVAVGERGHVLVSTDSGRTWTQARVPTRTLLTGVHLGEKGLGWAVGHDLVVLRTRDGGLTWEQVHAAPEEEKPLLDVWFADAERGLAVGAYGTLLATADGGTTWTERPVHGEDDVHLNALAAAPDGTLYLAAEAGHLYRSTDGGETFAPLSSPYEGSFFGLLPLPDALLAFGLRGHVYRSEDRGGSWNRVETGSEATLTAGLDLGSGRVVVAGLAGTLLWSADGGRTFRLQELPDRKGIVALAAAGEGAVLLFGEGGSRRVEVPR